VISKGVPALLITAFSSVGLHAEMGMVIRGRFGERGQIGKSCTRIISSKPERGSSPVFSCYESVHLKIALNFCWYCLNTSGIVRAFHKRKVKSTTSGLFDTTFVRRVKRPK
jgi:hypothetical protein